MNKKNKELLFTVTKKDFIIEPYKGSGKGGQHRNKTMSCCRIKHPDSGVTTQACEERDFHKNRKVAFRRMIKHQKFEAWRKQKAYEISHGIKEVEKKFEEAMKPKNIKVEVRADNKWIEESVEEGQL